MSAWRRIRQAWRRQQARRLAAEIDRVVRRHCAEHPTGEVVDIALARHRAREAGGREDHPLH